MFGTLSWLDGFLRLAHKHTHTHVAHTVLCKDTAAFVLGIVVFAVI